MPYKYEAPYRLTGMGGLTEVYILHNSKLVKPILVERSRTGNHGRDIYELFEDNIYYVIKYNRSNSGKKSISVSKLVNNELSTLQLNEIPADVVEFLDENFLSWRYYLSP